MFKATLIFIHKIIPQWKWLPFPNNFTKTPGLYLTGLFLTILEYNGKPDREIMLARSLTCQHHSFLWAWEWRREERELHQYLITDNRRYTLKTNQGTILWAEGMDAIQAHTADAHFTHSYIFILHCLIYFIELHI